MVVSPPVEQPPAPPLPGIAPHGIQATLRRIDALLAQNLPEAAQAEAEMALRDCEDGTLSAITALAQAYIRSTAHGIDRKYSLKRGCPNPFAPVVPFVERNPWLLRRDLSWLEGMLRINAKVSEPIVGQICAMALDQGPSSIGHLQSMIGLATRLPSAEIFIRAGRLMRPLVEQSAAASPREEALRWCQIGDAALLAHDLDTAESCYRLAVERGEGHGYGLLGLSSVQLDRGDLRQAVSLGQAGSAALAACGHTAQAEAVAAAIGLWDRPHRPLESFEVMVFCHVTTKLKRNARMAAPSIALVETAVRSLRQHVGIGEIPITLHYDHQPTALNNAFALNLLQFSQAENIPVAINTQHGLRRQWLQAFARSRADIVMIVEQDHEFLAPCPSPADIAEIFRQRPDIGYLRLNRRANLPLGVDKLITQTPRDADSQITRTTGFSNTPHFLRRDYYDAVVHPAIRGNAALDQHNSGAGGVEENVGALVRRITAVAGLPVTMRLFGLAIWGAPDAPAMSNHLGI